MKAWICRNYGGPDVLALEERPRPEPKDGEVLIRVRATTVSSGDMRIRSLKLPRGFGPMGRLVFGFTRPRQPVLGTELSGIVERVGGGVTAFKPADAVVAFPGARMRAHAEYHVIRADKAIVLKPENLSFEAAAGLCFGGTTAVDFFRRAGLKSGESVLVIGASGAVGVAMVQLARHLGAQVTAVTSTGNVELARSLGAHFVIDYSRQDFAAASETYDVIADTVGASTFAECLPLLNENGRYLAIAGDLFALFGRRRGTKRSIAGPAGERPEDVRELVRLATAGIVKPVIDKVYGFQEMPAAHARVDTGRKRGNVVVTVSEA